MSVTGVDIQELRNDYECCMWHQKPNRDMYVVFFAYIVFYIYGYEWLFNKRTWKNYHNVLHLYFSYSPFIFSTH